MKRKKYLFLLRIVFIQNLITDFTLQIWEIVLKCLVIISLLQFEKGSAADQSLTRETLYLGVDSTEKSRESSLPRLEVL